MPDLDERSLEETLRRGLATRAAQAPTALDRPLPEGRAATAPARRRWPTWPLAAAAALLVAVGIPVIRFATDQSVGPSPDPPTGQASSSPPGTWRMESYAGVEVAVPPAWGYGGSPTSGPGLGQRPLDCGATRAFVAPDGGAYEGTATAALPFVGRPAMMTDACGQYQPGVTHPAVDAVWFESPLPVGTARYPDGQVGETVDVSGQHVSVFSRNAGLRARILEFVGPVLFDANGCSSEATAHTSPSGDLTVHDPGGLAICVYGSLSGTAGSSGAELLLSSRRGPAEAGAYLADVAHSTAASAVAAAGCEPGTQWVAIGVLNQNGSALRWDVVEPGCNRIATPGGFRSLTAESVRWWADGGIRAYVVGPARPTAETAPFFRGILG